MLFAGLVGLTTSARAQLYFDVTSGSGLGTASGSYNWDTSTSLWNNNSSGAGTWGAWTNGSAAVFNAGNGSYSLNTVTALTGANITVSQGDVTISDGAGSYQLSANSTYNITGSLTFNESIGQNASGRTLTKSGNGALTLAGNNTFSGALTLSAGTLNLNSATANGGGAMAINGGTLDNTSGVAVTLTNNPSITLGGTLTFAGTNDLNLGTGAFSLGGANRTFAINGSSLTIGGVVSQSSGSRKLTKTGAGTLVLTNAANTYTGATTINGGTLSVSKLAAGGAASSIGNSTNAAGNLVINGGTLKYTGGGDATNRRFTLGASGGALDASGSGAITFNSTNAVTFAGTNARTFTLSGSNTDTNTLAASIGNNTGATSLTKTDGGTWALTSAASSYTGVTTVDGGVLQVSKLANGGSNSSIGASSNAAGNLVIDGGTLRYAGTSDTTNRLFTVGAGGATIEAAGSGALSFTNTGSLAMSGSGDRTLTLGGASTANNTLASIIANPGTGTTSLIKNDAGLWLLTGTNTYTGPTTINGGILQTTGSNRIADASDLIIGAGGTFQFDWGANSETVGALSGSGTLSIRGSNFTTSTAADTTFSGTITDSYGTFHKAGTGNLTLTGTNTFTGLTYVDGGTLTLGNSAALGGSTSGNVIANGATLALQGGITVNEGSFSVQGTGAGAVGAIYNLSGNNTLNATLNLAGATTIGSAAGTLTLGNLSLSSDLTFEGAGDFATSGSLTSTGSLIKNGSGTLTLSGTGANSYGATKLNDGTIVLAKSATLNALGQGAITIGDGAGGAGSAIIRLAANDQIADYAPSISFDTDGRLDLNGFNESLNVISGTAGQITLGSGTLTLGVSSGSSTYGGTIAGSGSFIKSGTGTVTFNGSDANTYSGTTTVNGGILVLAKSGGATAVGGNLVIGDGSDVDTVRLDAANQIASTSAVTFTAGGTPTLNLNGFAQTLGSIASTNSSAVIAFGSPGGATDFTVGDATSTAYAGTFSSGNANGRLVKQGTGTLTLSGTSSGYSGPVLVNQGTLKVQSAGALGAGTAGTTVASGATLQLDSVLAPFNGTLTLSGTGVSGVGALYGTGGNNRWESNITLAGDATIGTNATGYLALGLTTTRYNRALSDPSGTPTDPTTLSLGANTLTLTGTTSAANHIATYINAQVTGTGNLVIAMTNATDTVRMTNNYNPTFTGTTQINNGILSLATLYNTYPADPAHPNFFAINGPVVIGDGTGAANSAQLTIQANTSILYDEMMNYTTPITLKSDGQFSLLAAQTIGALTFNGGNIDLGTTGSLFLNDDVTVNASAGHTATITGSGTSALSLTIHQGPVPVPNATRTFNLVGGAGNTSDLTIGALIYNGSIVKTGAGTMTITSDNHAGYEGTTTINNGTLAITNNSALGQSDGTDTSATLVNGNGTTNGTLQLSNNITVTNEKLTLNNTGYGNNGALRNLSGNNTWNGEVVVNDARTQSDAGLLTLNNTVTINTALEVTGSGNTTISGPVGGATGTLTKNGTGTLIVSGTNTYGGATTINTGVLSLQSNAGLGAATGGTTVSGSGGALELSNAAHGNLTTSAEPLALNGTGISGNGALRNAAGNNTFAGQVTLQSAALLTANTGTTLTLSGGVTSANQAATFGTTANNGNITITGNLTNGSGSLTKAGSGTLAINGTGTNTAGATHLNAGKISVASGATLNTGAFDSAVSTTLIIGSGGTVVSNYASGSTTFSGAIDGTGGGTFQKDGAGTLVFDHSFNAGTGSTLVLNGGTLSLASAANITFGTIHITADTVLDFNGTNGTVLSSANLIIDAGVHITVNNWKSTANQVTQSTVWYATSTVNSGTLSGADHLGNTPLNQITFTNYDGMTTTWVAGNHNGWFDHEIRPTPEPATYGVIFLGAGLALVTWRRVRQRRRAARSSASV
ncbi:autotransporter-associated beta strand repeat-containing protein [Horticoccus luteus]|uniref:Autotransporter-associated beta strand repeat-containing protein n=1 Tax=Horticoccus luteus TaxID=2862869 RepID=A0A8F9XJK6_9BACT|nr:autotransporter-associated beta strand repeat-containing protein [Horticoccus luteus]QYM78758.1 autotransporter-associated beta strand repeat-containing protein [Horticoccus luteus]